MTGSLGCRNNDLSEQPFDTPRRVHLQVRSSSSGTADLLQQQNVYASYQSNAGPNRTEFAQGRRFQPYETPRVQPVEHVGEEDGESTLVLPPIQSASPLSTVVLPSIRSLGLPTMQPSGGIPETPADAETDSEEDEAQVSDFHHFHIPRASNGSPGVRNGTPPRCLVARATVGSTAIRNGKIPLY